MSKMCEGEEQVKVINLWVSLFGMRVLIGLEEKGVTYEYQEDNLESKGDLLLQMNPVHKQVPVLIHNGKPVCESLIILEYIDEAWPGSNPLMPSNPYDRALARFWADFLNKEFFEGAFYGILKCTGEAQEEGKRYVLQYLGLLKGSCQQAEESLILEGNSLGSWTLYAFPMRVGSLHWKRWGNGRYHGRVSTRDFKSGWRHAWRESVNKILPGSKKVLEYAIQFRKRFVSSK